MVYICKCLLHNPSFQAGPLAAPLAAFACNLHYSFDTLSIRWNRRQRATPVSSENKNKKKKKTRNRDPKDENEDEDERSLPKDVDERQPHQRHKMQSLSAEATCNIYTGKIFIGRTLKNHQKVEKSGPIILQTLNFLILQTRLPYYGKICLMVSQNSIWY